MSGPRDGAKLASSLTRLTISPRSNPGRTRIIKKFVQLGYGVAPPFQEIGHVNGKNAARPAMAPAGAPAQRRIAVLDQNVDDFAFERLIALFREPHIRQKRGSAPPDAWSEQADLGAVIMHD